MTTAVAPRKATDARRPVDDVDSGILRETAAIAATLCGTIPVLLPLTERGMAVTHDGFLHVQRLIALETVVQQGAPFTRWLPDLAYGYGQPLLLYYAPLSYVPALLVRFFGAGYGPSIEIATGLALVLSALAMYLLGRSLFGRLAATVAAIVYVTLPYQLVDVYVRGALAESWAFVWLPLCAWCLVRARTDGSPRWHVGTALTVAGLVLTHNVTALLFLPALVALLVLLEVTSGDRSRQLPIRSMLALGLGLALGAWFWLPALAERSLVQIGETIEPELFASFFLRSWPPFRDELLFDYQLPVSTALGYPIFWPQVGSVQAAVTVVGLVAAGRTAGLARTLAIWGALLAFGGFIIQLRPLAPLYDLVPLLTFVQFPWRFLALVGLGSAILAGVLAESVSRQMTIRGVFAVAIVAASLVTALAKLDPEPVLVDEQSLSTETIARIELADYGLGTTHSGEYLPVSSGQRNAARFRKTMIEAGGASSRQSQAAPSGINVERVDWRPDRLVIDVMAAAPDRLMLHQFSFPGWQAWIDGVPVATHVAGQLGLMTVDVPAGRHTVEMAWGWTPLRVVAAAVSVAALLLLGPLGSAGRWRPTPRTVLVAFAVTGLAVELLGPAWLRPMSGAPDTVAASRASLAGDALQLVEVRHDTARLASDRLMLTRLIWHVRQAPSGGYRAHVRVTSADGQEHRAPWVYEPLSQLWVRGEIVPTTVAIRLPPEFPPGAANLSVVFERPGGIEPLALGSIDVPTARTSQQGSVSVEGVPVGSDIRLSAGSVSGEESNGMLRVRRGSSLDVPLRWEEIAVTPNVDRELQVLAVLVALGGEITSEVRRPGDWYSPLPFWQRGEVIEQNVRLTLPSWLAPGTYPLSVRVYARDLARSGASEPGASSARPRGRPTAELMLGNVTVER